jgi:hypothetical protein
MVIMIETSQIIIISVAFQIACSKRLWLGIEVS